MRLIITDLTRFSRKDIVCTAGIDLKTGQCVRPMPYLQMTDCRKQEILPGVILEGRFTRPTKAVRPHTEDMQYDDLSFHGPCSSGEFHKILSASVSKSVQGGFNVHLESGQKHIPTEQAPNKSLLTIKVQSTNIEIVPNDYKPGELKINFVDSDKFNFRYLSITDLGFYEYAQRSAKNSSGLKKVNQFLAQQKEIFLRVGLSRVWKNNDREGYWIQINGIYTFPKYMEEIRAYS